MAKYWPKMNKACGVPSQSQSQSQSQSTVKPSSGCTTQPEELIWYGHQSVIYKSQLIVNDSTQAASPLSKPRPAPRPDSWMFSTRLAYDDACTAACHQRSLPCSTFG